MPYLGSRWSWKKCAECGKRFEIFDGAWAYKTNDRREKFFCSWHCLRAAEAKDSYKKGKPRTEKEEAIYRMLREGAGVMAIVHQLGVTESTVKYYKDRFMEEDAV